MGFDYTPDQRARRNGSRWSRWQAVLAPIQMLVVLASAILVIRYLLLGQGFALTNASVILKLLILAAIMTTGALWEHDVYGKYLIAPQFFWEDMGSSIVCLLHLLYPLAALLGAAEHTLALLILAAYVSYALNAAQYLVKLRRSRLHRAVLAAVPTP